MDFRTLMKNLRKFNEGVSLVDKQQSREASSFNSMMLVITSVGSLVY